MNKRKEIYCVFPLVLYFLGLPYISISEFSIGGVLEGKSSHLVSMPLMRKMFKLDLETFLMACYFY